MQQQALERALGALILGPAVDPGDPTAVSAWLESSGVDGDDAVAIRESDIERLLVYRRLVRHTLRGVLEKMLPRTLARLGEDIFVEYFDRFLAERAPRTHYLRDVTHEFVKYCTPLWPGDARVASYLGDLARHESLEFEVSAREDEDDGSRRPRGGSLELDRPLAFITASAVVRYDYAVHELSSDPADHAPAHTRPTTLFVYRDPEHEVRFLELTALAAAIIERLLDGRTLRDAVDRGCASLGVAAQPSVLDGLARVLADLAERGALAGLG